MGLWPTPHLSGEDGSGGRKRHPCRDHFEICEDFRAIWTRCQSAPDRPLMIPWLASEDKVIRGEMSSSEEKEIARLPA
ncbi:hypothetical protein ATANTOWER_000003 [Ataeniobius toweri]|uniref:Uncharacterized protein n=1 Tax=Ataeniobius toweri TaxID=208326 RepID=A0ABU7A0L2_9TELE|nr:hypothetical protein [Ataeniobius toweri]